MKTFTQIVITLATTMGLTGGALAGDPKGGAPAQPAKEKAPEGKKAPEAAKAPEAGKKMEMMKPPQELADMAKSTSRHLEVHGQGRHGSI